jgi:hypothetical protein
MSDRWFRLSLLSMLLLTPSARAQSPVSCSVQYSLPADIPVSTMDADDDTFQQFGWQTFLGLNAPSVGGQISTTGDNVPQWAAWSATVDLLLCQGTPTPAGCICASGGCTQSGTHYYPTECQAVPNYQNYRVLDQVSKVDDSFEEAATNGLSGDPVIDRFGHFLRYEILISPAMYSEVIQQQLYDPAHLMSLTSNVNLGCGSSSYTGGDPANAQMGTLVVKAAWMDVTDELQSGAIDPSMYHLDQLLVYTPYYRNSSGVSTCELRTMAVVGLHFAHKTVNQPTWIWSTFEHTLNAPDCTGPMPAPNTKQANTSCPTTVSTNYNFNGENCNGSVQACAACNAPPTANGNCDNPNTTVGNGFCLDEPPAANGGISKLCRQVPIADYPEAAVWNSACQTALGPSSVWSNYSLISSQWGTSGIPAGCSNVAAMISGSQFQGGVTDSLIDPKITTADSQMKSLLANTSMESYDRSNCIGCHSKANFNNSAGTPLSTDFMYWLELQVLAPAATRPKYLPAAVSPSPAPSPTPTPTSGAGSTGGGGSGCQVGATAHADGGWMLLAMVAVLALRRRRGW